MLAAFCLAVTGGVEGAVTGLRVCNLLFLAAGLLALLGLLERQRLGWCVPLLAVAVAWSPSVLDYLRLGMSEIPYLGISLVTMLALQRANETDERPWPHALGLAGLCIVALFLRTFGVVVFLAVITHLWFVGRRRTAARVATCVVPVAVALQLFLAAHARAAPGYEDVTVYGLPYLRLFVDGLPWVHRTVLTNSLQTMFYGLNTVVPPAALLPPAATLTWIILWSGVVVLGALAVLGVRAELRDRGTTSGVRPWHWLLVYSLLLMLPWPAQVARFLLPLMPFGLLLVVRGAARLAGSRGALAAASVFCLASVSSAVFMRGSQTLESFSVAGTQHDVRGLVALADQLDESLAEDAVVACTMDLVLAHHGGITGVWGWTIDADRHVYADPPDVLQFNLGNDKWDWVLRELWAARLFHVEFTSSRSALITADDVSRERDAIQRFFGTTEIHKRGDDREPLLQRLETDRQSVRAQFRRLGVTHAVVLLRDGNALYDALLARLLRQLATEGKAEPVAGLSTLDRQVWRIRW